MLCFIVVFILIGNSSSHKNLNHLLHKVREILDEVNENNHANSHKVDNHEKPLSNGSIKEEPPIDFLRDSRSLENVQEKDLLYQINKELSKDEPYSKEDLNYILRCDGDKCGLRGTEHEDKDKNNVNIKKGGIVILSPVNLDTIQNYNNVLDSSESAKHRQLLVGLQVPKYIPVIPDKLAGYYEKARKSTISYLQKYVMGKTVLRKNEVSASQYQRLLKLKKDFLSKKVTRRRLKEKIDDIIFGTGSSTKIYYKEDHDSNIHVPKWLYKKIHNAELKEAGKPRLPKSILAKGSNKNSVVKYSRRGNFRDIQNYGVPFELDLEGLGQVVV